MIRRLEIEVRSGLFSMRIDDVNKGFYGFPELVMDMTRTFLVRDNCSYDLNLTIHNPESPQTNQEIKIREYQIMAIRNIVALQNYRASQKDKLTNLPYSPVERKDVGEEAEPERILMPPPQPDRLGFDDIPF